MNARRARERTLAASARRTRPQRRQLLLRRRNDRARRVHLRLRQRLGRRLLPLFGERLLVAGEQRAVHGAQSRLRVCGGRAVERALERAVLELLGLQLRANARR